MKHNFIRYSMIILLIGFGTLADGQAYAWQEPNWIEIQSYTYGISHGQTARVSLINVPMSDGSVRLVSARIQLLDTEGRVIAQSNEISVAPGQARYWDAPRESLPAGEPTGRLQLRARILIRTQDTLNPPPVAPAVEIFDSGTGRTVMSVDVFLRIKGLPAESVD